MAEMLQTHSRAPPIREQKQSENAKADVVPGVDK